MCVEQASKRASKRGENSDEVVLDSFLFSVYALAREEEIVQKLLLNIFNH
jgi:hypothetical protein